MLISVHLSDVVVVNGNNLSDTAISVMAFLAHYTYFRKENMAWFCLCGKLFG